MAIKALIKGTSDPLRPFTITIPPNVTVTPSIHIIGQGRAVPSNCDMPTQAPDTTIPATPPNNIQDQLLLKDREIIGIAIGLFFGGMVIGFLLTLLVICICRCVCGVGRGGSYKVGRNVQYKKHNDDVAFPT